MSNLTRLAMAQCNFLVGDISGNTEKILHAIQTAKEQQAQLVVFSELAICGYPPEDLLFRDTFLQSCEEALAQIQNACDDITAIVGTPIRSQGKLFNAAAVLQSGCAVQYAYKQCLPNYGVFDERRYFAAGEDSLVVTIAGTKAGITVCEDIWSELPGEQARARGMEILININASPFHEDKPQQRTELLQKRTASYGVPIIYVNQVGGQDELLFDGMSFAMDADGMVQAQLPAFNEEIQLVELSWEGATAQLSSDVAPVLSHEAAIYDALVLSVRDFIYKNGFKGALLGLSGGIDSALTLAIAVDALGTDAVTAVMMPSEYTADISLLDAEAEAEALGVEYHVIEIKPAYETFSGLLQGVFANTGRDVTEENLQARSRGVVLMAISNKLGRMLLATGNKSEMAVGYATLYGDMAGGFAPLKDVYKTLVYRLARYRNTISPVIPERVITRPPSAELAPDQTDQDTLPDYDTLDAILEHYIEDELSAEEIISRGYGEHEVKDTIRRVDFNEYKRRQAAPGPKITRLAFGRERRYPITCAKN